MAINDLEHIIGKMKASPTPESSDLQKRLASSPAYNWLVTNSHKLSLYMAINYALGSKGTDKENVALWLSSAREYGDVDARTEENIWELHKNNEPLRQLVCLDKAMTAASQVGVEALLDFYKWSKLAEEHGPVPNVVFNEIAKVFRENTQARIENFLAEADKAYRQSDHTTAEMMLEYALASTPPEEKPLTVAGCYLIKGMNSIREMIEDTRDTLLESKPERKRKPEQRGSFEQDFARMNRDMRYECSHRFVTLDELGKESLMIYTLPPVDINTFPSEN